MSNFANLDLCKELYELSGWDEPTQVWKYTEPMSTDIKYGVREDGDKWCYSVQPHPMKAYNLKEVSVWPAYDLGYLLRKLPYNKFFDEAFPEEALFTTVTIKREVRRH